MTSRRQLKAAQAIREVVSMAILADLKDPRIQNVTVTHVEVTGDMRQAKVHVSVMGDERKQSLALAGLRNAAGYLQRKVGDRIETRYTPRVEFHLDQGVKTSIEIARLLNDLLPEESPAGSATRDESEEEYDDVVEDEADSDDEDNDDNDSSDARDALTGDEQSDRDGYDDAESNDEEKR